MDESTRQALERAQIAPEGRAGKVRYVGPSGGAELEAVKEHAFNKFRKPPVKGLSQGDWKNLVNHACLLARLGQEVSIENLIEAVPSVEPKIIEQVFESHKFGDILEARGVMLQNVGLSERQMLTLNVLTNFTDTRKIATKLKGIGFRRASFSSGWERTHGSREPTGNFRKTFLTTHKQQLIPR